MKKLFISVLTLLIIMSSTFLSAAPYGTLVPSDDGSTWIKPLYEVGGSIPYGFTSPTDLYVDSNNSIYVADQLNVVVFEEDGSGFTIGDGQIQEASGIYVDEENEELYVADPLAKTVWVYGTDGTYLRQYDRPGEIYYGESTAYEPVDVAVSNTGKIYVASNGTTDGLVTMDQTGKFLGFFGANESAKSIYSFSAMSGDLISNFFRPTPSSITDVTIDSKGLVYTSTPGENNTVRQLNYASENILESDALSSGAIMDIWVDQYGNIFTVSNDEYNSIDVVDPSGEWLFSFGDYNNTGGDTPGLFKTPSAIAVDQNQVIYVADSSLNTVQAFVPTETALILYQGAYNYNQGYYDLARPYWEEMLTISASFPMAYDSNGMDEYKNGNYSQALTDFEKANNKEKYSDSYYFIRDVYISNNFILIVLLLVVLYGTIKLCSKNLFPLLRKVDNIVIKYIFSTIDVMMLVIKKPSYTFYLVKYKDKIDIINATAIYITTLIVLLIGVYFTDFLFSSIDPLNINLPLVIIASIVSLYIFLGANYLVSAIMFGESTFRQMYMATSLVFVPFIILKPVLIFLSYILTYNEASLYYGINILIIVWSLIILSKAISEMHNFSGAKTFRNLMVTIFTIIVIITIAITFGYLANEMVTQIGSIFKEALI